MGELDQSLEAPSSPETTGASGVRLQAEGVQYFSTGTPMSYSGSAEQYFGSPTIVGTDTGVDTGGQRVADNSGTSAAVSTDKINEIMPIAAAGVASSADEANLIISKDEEGNVTHKWNKPLDPSNNYQCKVFVDDTAKEDPTGVSKELDRAKTEAAKGVDAQGNKISNDGKKLTFQASPEIVESLTTKGNPKEPKGDPADEAPSGKGGGGRGGGGKGEDPRDDSESEEERNKAEAEKKAEEAEAAAAEAKQEKATNSRTLAEETQKQLNAKENGGMSAKNMAKLANQTSQNLWANSAMSSFISSHMGEIDLDGDGKISEEEMAKAMEKFKDNPEFKKAQTDLQDRASKDTSLADFKADAKGISGLHDLQKAGDNATAADVNRAFSPEVQSAISKSAIAKDIAAAGLKPGDPLPTDPAKLQALFGENGTLKKIIEKWMN